MFHSPNCPDKYLVESGTPRAFQRGPEIVFTQGWQQCAAFRVGALAGSCLFLPLSIVQAHGWMHRAWFLYCEEIDYCYRLRRLGVPSYMVPQAQIWHGDGGSHQRWQRVEDCIHYYRACNEIVLARRHAGGSTAALIAAKKLARGAYVGMRNARRDRLILLGVRDAILGRMGKTLAPKNFIDD